MGEKACKRIKNRVCRDKPGLCSKQLPFHIRCVLDASHNNNRFTSTTPCTAKSHLPVQPGSIKEISFAPQVVVNTHRGCSHSTAWTAFGVVHRFQRRLNTPHPRPSRVQVYHNLRSPNNEFEQEISETNEERNQIASETKYWVGLRMSTYYAAVLSVSLK